MSSQSLLKDKLRKLWETTSYNAKYLAYHNDLTEQSVRSMVTGVSGPAKEKHALTAYHRAIGMKLIDKRLALNLGKKQFAAMCGMSHFRLSDLEKGYDEITITELILTELLEDVALLGTTLLENE